LVMLDGVGHVPMSDDPGSVARLILEVTDAVDRGAVPPVADDSGAEPHGTVSVETDTRRHHSTSEVDRR
jgi:hypothetical protein